MTTERVHWRQLINMGDTPNRRTPDGWEIEHLEVHRDGTATVHAPRTPRGTYITDPDMARWCVKHRTGWCAISGNYEPEEGTWWVPTVCGADNEVEPTGIVAPWGYEHREPDCPDCLALLTEDGGP